MGNGTGNAKWLGHWEAYQQALRLGRLENLQPVRQQLGLADFRSVDEFAYALSQPAKKTGQ